MNKYGANMPQRSGGVKAANMHGATAKNQHQLIELHMP